MSSTATLEQPVSKTEHHNHTPAHSHAPKDWVKIAASISADLKKTATQRERDNKKPFEEIKLLKDALLTNLLIPKKFGGEGGTWRDAVHVVTELAKGDGSVAALLAFHYYASAVPQFFDFEQDGESILRESAKNRWLWGNILLSGEKEISVEPTEKGGYRITYKGKKQWHTGPSLADVTSITAPLPGGKEVIYVVVPSDRKGIVYHDDWDNLGLRLADTITVWLEDVEVLPHEVIPSANNAPKTGQPPFYRPAARLLYAAVSLGSTLGVLESALEYTRSKTKNRPDSGVESASKDPYILNEYGNFWIKTESVRAFLDHGVTELDKLWDRRKTATKKDLADLLVIGQAIRAYASEVGLQITPKIYDVTGAGATKNSYGFDRAWRDIRILSLHDPMVYAIRSIGDYLLNGELPATPQVGKGHK